MDQPAAPHERPLSQIALWAMIAGIVSFCLPPLGLLALAMGIIGIVKTGADKPFRGTGFAIAGTVLGALGLLSSCVWLGVLLPALGAARQASMTIVTQQRLGDLHAMVLNYHEANNAMPDPATWQAQIARAVNRNPDDEIFLSLRDDGDGLHFVFVPVSEPFDGDEIMFYEDPDHAAATGIPVVYDDGTTTTLSEADLRAALDAQGAEWQR